MKLATVDQVLTRMNKASVLATNTDVIESALDASTVLLEAILGTRLEYGQVIDYFDYLPTTFNLYKPFKVRLSRRFVEGIPSVHNTMVVNVPLTSVTSLSTANKVDESLYVIDNDKGVVQFLEGANYGFSSIAVLYEAGFEDLDVSTGEVDELVPQWMNEAAISGAIFAHHQQSTAHSKKDAKDMSNPLYQFLYRQVSNYIYIAHNDITPARTELL